MARPKGPEDLEKVTVRLFKGDMARLAAVYSDLGTNKAVRQLIRAHLNKIDASTKMPGVDIDLDLEVV
jgi:hypothetical protein